MIVANAMMKIRRLGMNLKMESIVQARVDSNVPSIGFVAAGSVDGDSETDWVTEESASTMSVTCCEVIFPPVVDRKV